MSQTLYEAKPPLEVFRQIALEFAEIPDETINDYLELSTLFLSNKSYGEANNIALALMSGHMMASLGCFSKESFTSTARVISRTEGDLSISYESISNDTDYLSTTSYGNLLLLLEERMVGDNSSESEK
ncbi:DUF4054 domain-containing protein [Paramixta manurensis]|uniref:DUF4054 domain-containing protein n=1 Tax=Paramixta manurensis TaxID=2740817 RepID=A0A6M8UG34_9GAMM|nr:DUF4054 domain-containing protein [Erwiniaceae bacterium PD-1]